MKFENKFVLIIVACIAIYATFLFISDMNIIYEKISTFQFSYLPLILTLVTLSWIPLFLKWNFLLKNCEINLPIKQSILVFLSGPAFEITPGQVGVLMKSQILKNSSNISRTKTVPIIMLEKIYDLIGAIIASVLGIIILGLNFYLIIIAIVALTVIFFFMYYKPASKLFFNRLAKTKFFSKYIENISEFEKYVEKSTTKKISTLSILLSVSYWFIMAGAAYTILLSFDVDIFSYLEILSIYSTSILLGAISFIPAGMGVTEGSITGLLTVYGLDLSTALILSVMIRILTLWYSVSVGFIAAKFSGGLSFKNDNLPS